MKRLLSICLLMAIIIGSSSFTSFTPNSQRNLEQWRKIITVYYVVNQYQSIPNTNCVGLIHMSGTFDYNTVTQTISNPHNEGPTYTVVCNLARIVYPEISTFEFDSNHHVSQLAFSKTGDGDVDPVLSDPNVISSIISDINSQIDSQIQ